MPYEIRLLDPAGMVAQIHSAAIDQPCAITRARILLDTHREMASAQVRRDGSIIEIACETEH